MSEPTGVWAELAEALQSAPSDALDRAEKKFRDAGDQTALELIASQRRSREAQAKLTLRVREWLYRAHDQHETGLEDGRP